MSETYTRTELFENFKEQVSMIKKWMKEGNLVWKDASDKYFAELFVRGITGIDDDDFYDYFYNELGDLLGMRNEGDE